MFANTKYQGPVLDGGTKIGRVGSCSGSRSTLPAPDRWALVCLIALVLVGLMVANLRRSPTGRRLVAVRTNERCGVACISVFSVKLYAFAVASAIAAIAGILLAFKSQNIQYLEFNVFASINHVGYAVVGGLGFVLAGAFAAPNAVGGIGTRITEDWLHLHAKWDLIIGSLIVMIILIVQQDGIAATAVDHARPMLKKLRLAGKRDVASALRRRRRTGAAEGADIAGLTVRWRSRRSQFVSSTCGPAGGRPDRPERCRKTTVIDAVTGFVRQRRHADARRHGQAASTPGKRLLGSVARPIARAVRGSHDRGQHPPVRAPAASLVDHRSVLAPKEQLLRRR